MKQSVSAKALETWIKEFFEIENADVIEMHVTHDGVTIEVLDKDEDGNRILVGPAVARQSKRSTHDVALLRPGRPEGATVANGAKPRTKKLPTE